ncbi:MAG: SDR family oxidoreductase [Phaeodactylibacter sp.]|nr:SDR family oxidoreductase [Phaeodactylibacter sp.]
MNKLASKTILITGATGKIALAFAELALSEGPKAVVLSGIDDAKGRDCAKALGEKCYYRHLDVTRQSDWQETMSFISENFGCLNVLVNNASITGTGLQPPMLGLENSALPSWQAVIRNDLDSIFLGCREAVGLLKSSGNASIVNIGSRSSLVARPDRMAYAAAKAAAISLTKSVAIYCAERGYNIRCNIVLPSTILTEMWDPVLKEQGQHDEKRYRQIADRIPLRRFGRAEEVAKAILFLASDDSSYITGTEIVIDGGAQAQDVLRGQTWA